MITIIGTGHVFNISEQIMFLIKQIWPQAVLVELDGSRLNALESSGNDSEPFFFYKAPNSFHTIYLMSRKTI